MRDSIVRDSIVRDSIVRDSIVRYSIVLGCVRMVVLGEIWSGRIVWEE